MKNVYNFYFLLKYIKNMLSGQQIYLMSSFLLIARYTFNEDNVKYLSSIVRLFFLNFMTMNGTAMHSYVLVILLSICLPVYLSSIIYLFSSFILFACLFDYILCKVIQYIVKFVGFDLSFPGTESLLTTHSVCEFGLIFSPCVTQFPYIWPSNGIGLMGLQ